MNPQQNLNDMVDEMSSVLLTLQTDMIKVMNGINQLNLIITKIKQYNENNTNNNINNNMMNINNNMQNMAMGMNNMMGIQNMNMLMPMNGIMNNMNFGIPGLNLEDHVGWNLLFENQWDKKVVTIRISEKKQVKEAINMYKIKSNNNRECKYRFNNKELIPEMKICQSGLNNFSKILVLSVKDLLA